MNLPFRKLRWLFLLTASFFLLWGNPLAEGRSPRPASSPEKTTFLPQEKHRPPVWSSTRSLSAHENAFAHWRKHKDEFPEFTHSTEYIRAAGDFVTRPPPGTLTKYRDNGDTLYYHPGTNTFAVKTSYGAPRTFFRPSSGRAYWNRQ